MIGVGRRGCTASLLSHKLTQIGHLALLDPPHDLPHLIELLDELVDLLDGRAGALGDAQPARALDQLGVAALGGRHREHDRLHAVELLLVDVHLGQLMAREAGDHPEQRGQRPHPADLLELVEEVFERELVLAQLALELLGLVLVDLLLGALDEREHVAHAEDPLGHPVGVELLEVAQLLARRGEEDRLARDRLDRQRRAAAGVAVELGQDHAVELRDLGELLGDVDRVLTGHRVDHEQHDVRLDALLDVRELGHERLVDVQAAARVDDQDVLAVALGLVERPAGDVDRVAVGPLLVDRRARLAADLDELLDGGRPVDVARRDRDARLVLLLEQLRELRGGRGLARALQARHEDDRRRPRREGDPRGLPAHQRRQLVVDDLDHLLARVELLGDLDPERALLDGVRELLDDLEVDVGLEQREADLAHGLVDVVLGQRAALTHPRQRALQLLRKRVEHLCERLYPWSSIFSSSARVPAASAPPSKPPSSASASPSPSAVTAPAASRSIPGRSPPRPCARRRWSNSRRARWTSSTPRGWRRPSARRSSSCSIAPPPWWRPRPRSPANSSGATTSACCLARRSSRTTTPCSSRAPTTRSMAPGSRSPWARDRRVRPRSRSTTARSSTPTAC